jgi:hypothetical protein
MSRKPFGFLVVVLTLAPLPASIYGQAVPVVSADIARTTDGLNAVAVERRVAEEVAEDAWYNRHELALGVDGNLPGNLRVFDESGRLVPARVKLYFLQSGKVVSQATPNDDGDFQVAGLKAGAYSIVAAGQSGFAAMAVRVLPPPDRPEPPKANTIGRIRAVSTRAADLTLNIPVIQAVDVQPAFGLAAANNAGGLGQLPGLSGLGGAGSPAGAAAAGGAAGGGGAGGGGAGGGMGGAGGLFALGAAGAGLAAAQNQNEGGGSSSGTTSSSSGGGGTPASPNGM